MSLRVSPVLLGLLTVISAGCGGDSPADPGSEPAAAVASVRIIAGDGQTDSAGATLPTAVVIEVLDVNGDGSPDRTIVLSQAGAEPNLNYQSGDPSGDVVTDSAGRAEVTWKVYGMAGTRHLIASVRGWAVVGKDTITATVIPAGPYSVEYAEPEVYRLLGEPADLGANILSVTDSWGNPVAVQTVVVEAPAPLELSGQTTILSHEETDTTVTLRINGVAFPQRVVVLRSIQEFLGAVGDWTCVADPASPSNLRSQAGHFVVDSITRHGDYSSAWTLHLSTTLLQTFADGGTHTEGPIYEQRYVLYQFPHGFLFPYGPEMDQIGTDPIRYREMQATQCAGWDGSGAHVPLTMTLTGP
ncbi:MAG: hypothetical protein ACJ8AM_16790 [Gemmatimonadales bacterium]